MNTFKRILLTIIAMPFAIAGGIIWGTLCILYYAIDFPMIVFNDIKDIYKE